MTAYAYLMLAIIIEVFASIQLKRSKGLRRVLPSIFTFAGYGLAFYFLAKSLIFLPMGVVFATWSGLGIASTVIFALLFLGEPANKKTIFALSMLLIGIIVLNFG